jgi:choline monooxygenase
MGQGVVVAMWDLIRGSLGYISACSDQERFIIMANLAAISPFKRPSIAQLPVSWYVDPAVYALEQKLLFPQTSRYVGHELMVPKRGDYFALDWMNNAKALVHNHHGIELISNVCRHRQALMLNGKGHTQHIICPLHRWVHAQLNSHL